MTEPQKELITIHKQDLIEFIASIGFQVEEYQDQNLTHGFEISGYQNAGDCFIIECASHSDNIGVLDEILEEMTDVDAWGEKGTGYLIVDDDVKSIIQRKKKELLRKGIP